MKCTYSVRLLLAASALVCMFLGIVAAEIRYSASIEDVAVHLSESGLTVNTSEATQVLPGRHVFYRIKGVIARGDKQYRVLLVEKPVCNGIGIYDATIRLDDLLATAYSANCSIISIRRCHILATKDDAYKPNLTVTELRYSGEDSSSLELLRAFFPNAHIFEN